MNSPPQFAAEGIEGLTATAQSDHLPISATLTNGASLRLQIHPQAYWRLREEALQSELTLLLRNVWIEYRRRYYEAISKVLETAIRPSARTDDPQSERFRNEWRTMPLQAASPDQRIQIRSEGLTQWQVKIQQGTLQTLPPDEFTAEFHAVFQNLINDYRERLMTLRDEHFDLNLKKYTNRSR